VAASKFGADCNLLVSPAKVKLGCCELLLLLTADELPPAEADLSNIHGTATCLPLPEAALEELRPVLELVLALGVVELVLELGVVELVLDAPESLKEMTANSNRPEFGLTIKSLIVPIWLPEEPVTWAPVSWLPRNASCPMRPVALRCLPLKPD